MSFQAEIDAINRVHADAESANLRDAIAAIDAVESAERERVERERAARAESAALRDALAAIDAAERAARAESDALRDAIDAIDAAERRERARVAKLSWKLWHQRRRDELADAAHARALAAAERAAELAEQQSQDAVRERERAAAEHERALAARAIARAERLLREERAREQWRVSKAMFAAEFALMSPDDVPSAYRRLSLIWHPDKPTGDEETFKGLAAAYERYS